jgi:uncharacterized protein (DUF1778 family)
MKKSKKILIRITPDQKILLQAAAVKSDKTMSQIIRSQIDLLR